MSLPVQAVPESCEKCPLFKQGHIRHVCIPARRMDQWDQQLTSAEGLRYLLVGEAPGSMENSTGLPFVGSAGKLLNRSLEILQKKGLDLSQVAVTNTVRCQPKENKNPPVKAKRQCRAHFDVELEEIVPDVVVLLGAQALSALLPEVPGGVGPNRLRPFEYRGYPVVVTFHPAAVLYDRTKASDLLDDLHAALVRRTWEETEVPDYPVELVNTSGRFEEIWPEIAAAPKLGLDIESQGFTGKILTVALALNGKAYVFPVFHREGHLDGREVLRRIRADLLERACVLVTQNGKFDLSKLAMATDPPVYFKCSVDDSMLFHYMLDEHAQARNLDYLSRRYTRFGGYKEAVDRKNLAAESLHRVAQYNGTDAALPPEIIDSITKDLKSQKCYSPQLVEWYRRVSPFVAFMESVGVGVDLDRLKGLETEYERLQGNLRAVCEEMAPGVNLGSPKQLSEHLYGTLGLEIPKIKGAVTLNGLPSTREDVIQHLDHPFVEKLLEWRGVTKILKTYVKQIFENARPDGRVYPEFFLAKIERGGTVSGRLSCKKPAMQTIPKESDLRAVFVSRYGEKGILLKVDAAQMELRYGAMISGDPTLCGVFERGEDPHQATGDLCETSRDVAKNINFGAVYDISIHGLVEKMGLPVAKARQIYKTVRSEWAGFFDYLDEIKQEATQSGEVCTPYGRWRRVYGATPSTPEGRFLLRQVANFVIQAPASDIIQLFGWLLMTLLEDIGLPCLSVHDEIVIDVREENLTPSLGAIEAAVRELPVLVKDVLGMDLTIPFVFEVKKGPNWLEMEKIGNYST